MMYENTLKKILEHDPVTSKNFLGVFARNELPENFNYPACFVFNTQNRNYAGEHWLALYYDKNGKCFFFDSYGFPPSFYRMENYIKKTSTEWKYNKQRVQGNSQYCGLYCIFFLLLINRGRESDFFKKFTSNLIKNDKFIAKQLEKKR